MTSHAKHLLKPAWRARFKTRIKAHLRSALASLGQLQRASLASFMTVVTLSVAMAIPMAFFCLVQGLSALGQDGQTKPQMSVYLQLDGGLVQAQLLADAWLSHDLITQAEVISSQQAMSSLGEVAGLAGVLDDLPSDMLPAMVVFDLIPGFDVTQLDVLKEALAGEPPVMMVQYDQAWLQRLQALLSFGRKASVAVGLLLAFGMLMIVGNTIRLMMQQRVEEMSIMALMGASRGFIARPFLYSGFWYGLLGALLALLLLQSVAGWLVGAFNDITALYGVAAQPGFLGLQQALSFLAAGMGLGWLGAYLVLGRLLKI